MQNDDLKIFKILYSGEIEEVINIGLIDLFSLLNVLAFYTREKKKMYIWVGEHASRTIKNYIVKFREIFKNDYPEYRVLRYITIESKTESFEFFNDTGIEKQILQNKISIEDAKYKEHTTVINQIKGLKEEADTYFEKEQYEEAIETSIKIIDKAREIDELSLVQDQIEFISEAKARAKAKSVLEDIRKEKRKLKKQFQNIRHGSDIVQVHNEANFFEQKYLEYLDLTALSDVKVLLNDIKKKFNELKTETKKSALIENFIEKIEILRSKAKDALNRREFLESINLFKEIIVMLNDHI